MIIEILEIARKNPNGFTIRVPELIEVNSGIISAYEATQDSFGEEGLKVVIQHAMANDKIVGGWKHEDLFYFDSCKVFSNQQEAIEFGKSQKQIAIFDLDELRLIKL